MLVGRRFYRLTRHGPLSSQGLSAAVGVMLLLIAGKHGGAGGGANALALPGGMLVVTDELAALADAPALLGLLAHEPGHVTSRHATRIAVAGPLLGATVAASNGDITSVVASAPVLLATLSFWRSHEAEADC